MFKEIEANNDLTDEEKATAKQEAQDKATAAKEAINNARTNAAVTQAKTDGTTEVTNVDPQPEAKTAAKQAIDEALKRVEDGSYGKCLQCGKSIPKTRLKALPQAELCIACKKSKEN